MQYSVHLGSSKGPIEGQFMFASSHFRSLCADPRDPDQQDAGLLLHDGGRKEYVCNAGDRRAPPGNAPCSRERTGTATLT